MEAYISPPHEELHRPYTGNPLDEAKMLRFRRLIGWILLLPIVPLLIPDAPEQIRHFILETSEIRWCVVTDNVARLQQTGFRNEGTQPQTVFISVEGIPPKSLLDFDYSAFG